MLYALDMVTAISTPNIALIKYWGNRNDAFRLPAADSLSMTLDTPTVKITVDHAERLAVNSSNKTMTDKDTARFEKTLDLMKAYLKTLGHDDALPKSLSITIDSNVPPAIGLASSAAVFSALAVAVSGLIDRRLTPKDISVLARLGSGSAARSIFGGYAAIRNGEGGTLGDAWAEQVADEKHWKLYDIVIAPTVEEKKVGSTEGHAHAATSPKFLERIEAIPGRMRACEEAIRDRDFEKLQLVAEEDCMDMHAVMQTQTPPLQYLSAETYRIVDEVKELRKNDHLEVLYTMDGGPTVHLFCTESALPAIRAFARAQKGCKVFEASVGKGARTT